MFASSLSIMLFMAIRRAGITTVLPMARCIMKATDNGGEISYNDLRAFYPSTKALNVILEREREKGEPLRIFPSDDGKIILNSNTAYAVGMWQGLANELANERGLGV